MKVYWKENGDRIGTDEHGNPMYQQIECRGIIVGSHHTHGRGYAQILVALPNGKFKSVDSSVCFHKTYI